MGRGRGASIIATFTALGVLAGLPAVADVWIGVQAVSPYWLALCFGVGAGAILQVIVELTGLIVRREGQAALASASSIGGIGAGLGIMYVTALFV